MSVAERRPTTVFEAVKKFCLTSTIRGVPKIIRDPSRLWRFIWFISVIAFLSVALYFTVSTIGYYLEYVESIIEETPTKSSRYFPRVTICDTTGPNYMWPKEWKEFKSTKYNSSKEYFNAIESLGKMTTDAELKYKFYEYLKKYHPLLLETVDDHFLASCKYTGKKYVGNYKTNCDNKTIYKLSDGTRCFMINTDEWPNEIETLKFEATLYFDDNDTIYEVNPFENKKWSFSAKVFLDNQQPSSTSDVDMNGYVIHPGHTVVIAGNVVHQIRNNLPKHECHENNDREMKPVLPKKYSVALCEQLYTQRMINLECNCTLSCLPEIAGHEGFPNCFSYSQPLALVKKQVECIKNSRQMDMGHCVEDCHTYRFGSTHWSRVWLKEHTTIDIMQSIIDKSEYFRTRFKTPMHMRSEFDKNATEAILLLEEQSKIVKRMFGQVHVSLPFSNVQKKKYVLADSAISTLSKVGGQLSLWVGVTFIAGVELLQLIYDIILVFCCWIKPKHHQIEVKKLELQNNISHSQNGLQNGLSHDNFEVSSNTTIITVEEL